MFKLSLRIFINTSLSEVSDPQILKLIPMNTINNKHVTAGLYFESDNMRKNKQSIIQINNTKDMMCMARAVVVGKCIADKEV